MVYFRTENRKTNRYHSIALAYLFLKNVGAITGKAFRDIEFEQVPTIIIWVIFFYCTITSSLAKGIWQLYSSFFCTEVPFPPKFPLQIGSKMTTHWQPPVCAAPFYWEELINWFIVSLWLLVKLFSKCRFLAYLTNFLATIRLGFFLCVRHQANVLLYWGKCLFLHGWSQQSLYLMCWC